MNLSNKTIFNWPDVPKTIDNYWGYADRVISLKGCPKNTNKSLNCSNHILSSLLYSPKQMKSLFSYYNNLLSLDYISCTTQLLT